MKSDDETLLTFPCTFPVKAIGLAGGDFDALVVEIISRHTPDLDPGTLSVRASGGGKWVAVTVTVQATSKAQLDAIYRDLTAHQRVVWAL